MVPQESATIVGMFLLWGSRRVSFFFFFFFIQRKLITYIQDFGLRLFADLPAWTELHSPVNSIHLKFCFLNANKKIELGMEQEIGRLGLGWLRNAFLLSNSIRIYKYVQVMGWSH